MAHIDVSNGIRSHAQVLIAERPGWVIADVVNTAINMVDGLGELKALTSSAELPEEIKTAADVGKMMLVAGKLLSGTIKVAAAPGLATKKVVDAIRKISVAVPAGDTVDVSDLTVLSYLSPSGWASIFKAQTMHLYILTDTGFYVDFPCEASSCWILHPEHVSRCQDGSKWKEMKGKHYHSWQNTGRVPSLAEYKAARVAGTN